MGAGVMGRDRELRGVILRPGSSIHTWELGYFNGFKGSLRVIQGAPLLGQHGVTRPLLLGQF